MWAVKDNIKFYINEDDIKECISDGYEIYSDDRVLLKDPEKFAVMALNVKGDVEII